MASLDPLFRTLAEASEDAIVLADGVGRIRYANAAMARLFGFTREQLERGELGMLRASWRPGGEPEPVEYRRADGTAFLAHTAAATLRDERGRVVGRGATIRPIAAAAPEPAPYVTAGEMETRRRDNLLSALERTGFKITGKDGAAALLGLAPSTLRSQMRALGIERPR